jgi:two-component system, NarL family, nitrate/nitrite response regulator NarL
MDGLCGARAPGVISALVISEVRFFRDGIVAALADAPDIGPVAGAAHVAELAGPAPDVVVVDLATAHSVAVIAAVRRAAPSARIVALGTDREDHALVCARAGVRGFVTRDDGLSDLVGAVIDVAQGHDLCPPDIGVLLLRGMTGTGPRASGDEAALTDREQDVLELLARGLSNKEIAAELVIQQATAKNHVHNVLRKLHVHRREQAAALVRGR